MCIYHRSIGDRYAIDLRNGGRGERCARARRTGHMPLGVLARRRQQVAQLHAAATPLGVHFARSRPGVPLPGPHDTARLEVGQQGVRNLGSSPSLLPGGARRSRSRAVLAQKNRAPIKLRFQCLPLPPPIAPHSLPSRPLFSLSFSSHRPSFALFSFFLRPSE